MSGHNPCICQGPRRERMKNWYVPIGSRNRNYSYFESPKGSAHISDYSTIMCTKCTMLVRSKALFVNSLPDGPPKTGECNEKKKN
jgi:hypothetical protein